MATQKVEAIIQAIDELTVLELSELIKELQEHYGVTAAPPAMAVAAPGAPPAAAPGAPAQEAPEVKQTFDVILVAAGDKKIPVIKVVREFTNLGLKEAKDFVESAPVKVKEGVSKQEAEAVRAKLEEVGATVEIK